MKRLIIQLLICFSFNSFAQVAENTAAFQELSFNPLAPDNSMLVGTDFLLNSDKKENVKGSPLMFETWLTANIILTRSTMENVLVNILNNEGQIFVLKVEQDSTVFGVDETVIDRLVVQENEQERVFKYYSPVLVEGKNGRSKFYEILHDGVTATLLKRETKKFIQADAPKAFAIKETPSRYTPDTEYFLKTGDNYTAIKLNKKSLLKALSGEAKEVANKIVKTQKPKLSKEAEVVKFLTEIEKSLNN